MVWEARQKKSLEDKRQEELRVMYEKEQEILNNKALLGDEKAKMGLSFMYDAPAGMAKREEPKEEPKFDWQRKYQAPREDWAKGNEEIQDQPFGIQVRNVRCCKCHKWGHVNTDRECALFGKSGNYEDEGYANNPSDLIKVLRKQRAEGTSSSSSSRNPNKKDLEEEEEDEWVDHQQLANDMKEEHGIVLKSNVLAGMKQDQQLSRMKQEKSEEEQMIEFFNTMSDKDKRKLMKKLMSGESLEDAMSKKKKKKDKKKKSKKSKRKYEKSDSEDEWEEKRKRVKKEVDSSPEEKRKTIKKEVDSDEEISRNRRRSPARRSRSPQRRRSRTPPRRRISRSRSRSPIRNRRRTPSPRRKSRRDSPDSPVRNRKRHNSSDSSNSSRSPSPKQKNNSRKRHDSSDSSTTPPRSRR
ncbi:unnamed protein product [Caenorhabditis angaria]|uniref:CBF1-interacting co-repressor CIR N-terminal domain-containing protein n=1 Tax=Caenorhabditis angaria TaxID=860376 RepID=A0A9P1I550_9PELO|nr:unnamed protein product [Caenorhabditis angaria]